MAHLFRRNYSELLFHGALHLCGFGDKTKKDKTRMTEKENEYLQKFETFHVKQ